MNATIKNKEICYEQQGNYLLPCLTVKQQTKENIGAWANRHRQYLKQYHRVRYYNLITSERLFKYLADIEKQAEDMYQLLVKSLAEKENITEKLKASAPTEWVQKMNNIRYRAMETVNTEMIFM